MNKERIKTVALIAACVIAVVCAIGWTVQAVTAYRTEQAQTMTVLPEPSNERLRLNALRASGSATEYVLTATVRPADAENKAVDWSIAWQDGTPKASEPVTEYVTVTPSSDGALTATVKCIKPFYGSTAIVTVTTREGGFTATAVITFEGAPTELTVNNGNTATQKITDTGTYSVTLNNVFGYVGDKYRDNVTLSGISVGGTYTSCNMIGYNSTGDIDVSDIKSNMPVSDLKSNNTKTFAECLEVRLNGNELTVAFTEELQYMCIEYENHGDFFAATDAFYGDLNAYADITVACGELNTTFRVKLFAGVTGVTLDITNVAF